MARYRAVIRAGMVARSAVGAVMFVPASPGQIVAYGDRAVAAA